VLGDQEVDLGSFNTGERAHHCRNRRRDPAEPDRHLRDYAEGTLRAYEAPGQIVARRGFSRAARRAHHTAIRQHNREREHVFAHRAVARRINARSSRRRLSANGGPVKHLCHQGQSSAERGSQAATASCSMANLWLMSSRKAP
jgi:hypothetical protein